MTTGFIGFQPGDRDLPIGWQRFVRFQNGDWGYFSPG
jgi:hypothetical protein